jgi:phosphomannomutase
MCAQAVAAGLRSVGCHVIDIGVVPTPTVPIMACELGAAGGIQVSSSHNTIEWNALKFFTAGGRNVDQAQLDAIVAAYFAGVAPRRWDAIGGYRSRSDAIGVHIDRVLAVVDVDLIRRAKLTVLIDSVNGAGSAIAPELLARLGCQVVPVYTRPDQPFPRDPEPTAANVKITGAMVRAANADVGFVQDPDADRLAVIDDRGTYIGEEYTLVLCAASRFSAMGGGTACTNLSTSRMLEDVAARHGGRVVRAKVGEANVVDAMQAEQAHIGGEGNGGVIDPRVVWGRDSHIGMALILELLARVKQPMSDVVGAIPRYAMHKEKVALDRAAVTAAIPKVQNSPLAQGAVIDTRDGLKLVWTDRWAHLRASGTEPVSRIITEAPTAAEAAALAGQVRALC